jgi:hypothetical protein
LSLDPGGPPAYNPFANPLFPIPTGVRSKSSAQKKPKLRSTVPLAARRIPEPKVALIRSAAPKPAAKVARRRAAVSVVGAKPATIPYVKPAAASAGKAARAGSAAAATGVGGGVPTDYFAQATKAVNSVYGPQYAGVDAQVALDRSQAMTQAQTYNKWAADQARLLAGIAPRIQGIYSKAANDTAVFGKGFSDGLQHAQDTNSGDINKILAQNGAPDGQMQHPGTNAADVLYGLGGELPASTLAAQGAAFASAAAFLPATALGRGQLAANQAFRDGELLAQKDELARYGIDANKANAVLQLSGQYQDAAAKQQALDMQYAALGLKQKNTQFDQNYRTATLRSRNATAQANIELRYASVFGADPVTGKPTLAAKKAAAQDARNAAKQKGLTPYQQTQLTAKWQQYASVAYHGTPTKKHFDSVSGKWRVEPGTGSDYTPYYSALQHLMQQGATLAQSQQILNSYYARGEGGRPYVSYQGRQALRTAGIPLAHDSDQPTQAQLAFLRQHGLWGA